MRLSQNVALLGFGVAAPKRKPKPVDDVNRELVAVFVALKAAIANVTLVPLRVMASVYAVPLTGERPVTESKAVKLPASHLYRIKEVV